MCMCVWAIEGLLLVWWWRLLVVIAIVLCEGGKHFLNGWCKKEQLPPNLWIKV